MTTKTEIRKGLEHGKKKGASHMVVVCDTFDYEDFFVYVMPYQKAPDIVAQYDGRNMQKVMEVYNLALDFETQLKQHRVFNY